MGNFDDQLMRMKALMTYGHINENNDNESNYTLEYKMKAADGKTYGIIKECNKYYIKQAETGKEAIAESYNYLGGFCNKKNYEYSSYANALKNFELKMSSINEAQESKINIETLDPFKKEILVVEATDKMKDEIARCRQIMYNASMLMNESSDYAVKGGKACSTAQPEAEKGAKGDKIEGSKDAKANPEYKGNHVGLDKKAEPFKENPSASKDQLKEDVSATETSFDAGMDKGRDPKKIGWDIEGEKQVNEDADEKFSEGLPSSAGVGEADSDHNNAPFNKTVSEACELYDNESNIDMNEGGCCEEDDETSFDAGIKDFAGDDDEFSEDDLGDEDFDIEDDEEFADEDELGGEDELGDEDAELMDDEEGLGDEDELGDDFDTEDNGDLMAKINELQAQIDALKSQIGNGEDELGDEDAELMDDEDELGGDPDNDFEDGEDFGEEEPMDNDSMDDEDFDEEDNFPMESKKQFKNKIVESVVRSLLKEDELHDFGKHPGYRKKPMELPATGEDKNAHGEDWNDESCHSEAPFGQQIGNGMPFSELVKAVTDDVMYQLKKGVSIEGEGKKKAE